MCDNFFGCQCPPKSGPGFRELTNYKNSTLMNEEIRYANKIPREDQYRQFLINNGKEMSNQEWNYMRANHSCWLNECAFRSNTMIPPSQFPYEMDRNNQLLTNPNHEPYVCKKYQDMRMTHY